MKPYRDLAFFVGLGMLICASAVFLVLKFANPDMTSTRLLLDFWPIVAAGAAGAGLMMWSMEGWR